MRLRLPTAVGRLHSQLTEMVGIFHKWNSSRKRKSCLNRLTITTPKTSPEIIALTLVEMQQLPEIEKVDSKN